jgi:2-C-methyl-D-erythritol 4-phosphate cytidylyltransferase
MSSRTLAVLVAAGRSSRMGPGLRKPFLDLEGRAVVFHAALALSQAPSVEKIVIVAHHDDVQRADETLRPIEKIAAILPGGAQRIDSVRIGALWPVEGIDLILVHDGARPLLSPAAAERAIQAAREHGAALLALPLSETLKRSPDGLRAHETIERAQLWRAQTPQVFAAATFRALLERAERERFEPTDDAALWERYVGPVALVPGEVSNLKITTPEHLELARALVRARQHKK